MPQRQQRIYPPTYRSRRHTNMKSTFNKQDRKHRHEKADSSSGALESNTRPRYFLLVAIACAFAVGFVIGREESTPKKLTSAISGLSKAINGNSEVSVDQLLGELTKKRLKLEEKLRRDYGEYYGKLFDPVQLKNIFLTSSMSRERLKRRLIEKVIMKFVDPTATVDFVWATGGDSSAAAHGNLFNQSYTAVLEDAVRPAFKALGINFIGRNYAMSLYQSAPELALCMEEVYGTDIDVLNWDFAMQEDIDPGIHKSEFWVERAISHSSLPILFFVDNRASRRLDMLHEKLESNGVGFVVMDKLAVDFVRARVPSTNPNFGPQLPLLNNWICDGAVEGSTPCDDPMRFFMCEQSDGAESCISAKYKTLPGCDRNRKANHPGWREHNFKGLLFAHFLLDVMEEALITLDAMKHPNGQRTSVRSQVLLEQLRGMRQIEAKNASITHFPATYDGANNALLQQLNPALLFRGRKICHTALLPAQTRFLGYLTDSSEVGTVDGGYETGQNMVIVDPVRDALPLTYDSADRQRCASSKVDHKDFFYLRNQDGWLHTIVPSRSEMRAYQHVDFEGIIIICLQLCPLDKCPDRRVGFGGNNDWRTKFDIRVEGQDVKNVLDLDHRCHVLEGASGIRWKRTKASVGGYKLSFRLQVREQGLEYSVKISSIIVF
mmetsp:Transcript_1243/g.1889  ORF Transcript_1243/g.1889 Transcript_1243/m.1889 type:complete len:663 (-) Transcript_1243:3626-5614(-)